MGNFIVFVVLIATGVALVVNAYYLNHHLVFLGWVEQKWGPGTGTLAYKIIGLALILLAALIITGVVDVFEDPLSQLERTGDPSTSSGNSPNPARSNAAPVNLSY